MQDVVCVFKFDLSPVFTIVVLRTSTMFKENELYYCLLPLHFMMILIIITSVAPLSAR